MRQRAVFALLAIALAIVAPGSASAQKRTRPPAPTREGPPHAWLFGTWTGGLFPVLNGMVEQDCRTQPTVRFSQDVVAHATLTGAGLIQRVIETVRTSPQGAEFRLTPDQVDPAGFGCDGPDSLNVARQSDSTISFPRCGAFPYPLQRCPGR
jgi:hypothetical protein